MQIFDSVRRSINKGMQDFDGVSSTTLDAVSEALIPS